MSSANFVDIFEYDDIDGDRIEVYDGGDMDGAEAALAVDVAGRTGAGLAYLPASKALELGRELVAWAEGVTASATVELNGPYARVDGPGVHLESVGPHTMVRLSGAAAAERESRASVPDLTRELLAEVRAIREGLEAERPRRVVMSLDVDRMTRQRSETVAGAPFEVPTDSRTAAARWQELQGGARR